MIVAAAEWRLGAELLQHQLLHRVVEKPPAGANAGLAGVARTPGNSQARSKSLVVGAGQAAGTPASPGTTRPVGTTPVLLQSGLATPAFWKIWIIYRIGELAGIDRAHLSRAESLHVLADVGKRSK